MLVHTMTMTLEALRENSTLEKIYLHENNIGDKGAEELAKANEQISHLTRPGRAKTVILFKVFADGFYLFQRFR